MTENILKTELIRYNLLCRLTYLAYQGKILQSKQLFLSYINLKKNFFINLMLIKIIITEVLCTFINTFNCMPKDKFSSVSVLTKILKFSKNLTQ